MKAIQVTELTLPEIKRDVSRPYFRDLKRRHEIAKRLETPLFFIPYYIYPECGDIPRAFIVSEQYLTTYFGPLKYFPFSEWIELTPKAAHKYVPVQTRAGASNVRVHMEPVLRAERALRRPSWASVFQSAPLHHNRHAGRHVSR